MIGPLRAGAPKDGAFWRRIGSIAGPYDVLISGSNEVDFGRPGIQQIHYPETCARDPICAGTT
jgi:hypothetical protein